MNQTKISLISNELDFVISALKKGWGEIFSESFQTPSLLLGDEHISKFIEIRSMRDVATAHLLQAAYDSTTNELWLADGIINGQWPARTPAEIRSHRMFALTHESVHALLSQLNPKLTNEHALKLLKSQRNKNKTLHYVYTAFHEGLANYLAIQALTRSGDCNLAQKAQSERVELLTGFAEWLDSPGFKMMALVYAHRTGELPKDYYGDFDINYQKTLFGYFSSNPEMLSIYKYLVGYRFASDIAIDQQNLETIIAHPPQTIEELIYPRIYTKTVGLC